jgi:hypothetical protein
MRDQRDVQRAHDILHALVTGEVDFGYGRAWTVIAHGCHDVLSWVLQEDCGQEFESNLAIIEEDAKRHGFKLVPRQ